MRMLTSSTWRSMRCRVHACAAIGRQGTCPHSTCFRKESSAGDNLLSLLRALSCNAWQTLSNAAEHWPSAFNASESCRKRLTPRPSPEDSSETHSFHDLRIASDSPGAHSAAFHVFAILCSKLEHSCSPTAHLSSGLTTKLWRRSYKHQELVAMVVGLTCE